MRKRCDNGVEWDRGIKYIKQKKNRSPDGRRLHFRRWSRRSLKNYIGNCDRTGRPVLACCATSVVEKFR